MSDRPTDPRVTRPADLTGAPLRELLDAWHQHIGRLVDARHGLGEPLPPARLGHHALAALATGQALADRLTATRWVTAVDALTYGATVELVAGAMGLDVEAVTAGLRMWADGQHQHAGMSAATRDEVYALSERYAR